MKLILRIVLGFVVIIPMLMIIVPLMEKGTDYVGTKTGLYTAIEKGVVCLCKKIDANEAEQEEFIEEPVEPEEEGPYGELSDKENYAIAVFVIMMGLIFFCRNPLAWLAAVIGIVTYMLL